MTIDNAMMAQPNPLEPLYKLADTSVGLTGLSAMTRLYEMKRAVKDIISSEFGTITPQVVTKLRYMRIEEMSPVECADALAAIVDDLIDTAPAPQPAAPVQGATAPTPNEARGQLSDDDTITYIRQRFAKRMDGSSGMSWDHEEIQALLDEIDALRAKLPAVPVAAPEPTSATPTFNSHGSQRPDDYTSNAVTVRAVGSAEHELSYPEPETSTAPVTTATKLERGQKATYTYMNNHKKVKSACLVYSVYRLSAEILLVSDITGLVQQRSVRLSSLTPRDNTLGFIDAKLQHEYER